MPNADAKPEGLKPGQPIISWALIARNEGANGNLERCLLSLRERTPHAEIIVVDTCSSDNTVEVGKKYADRVEVYRGPRGDWSKEMYAFDDAAAARNYAFGLAKGYWVGYIDADDTLPPGDISEKILIANSRRKPTEGVTPERIKDGPRTTLEDLLRAHVGSETFSFLAEYAYRFCDLKAAEAGTNYACDSDGGWQTLPRIVRNTGEYGWLRSGHEFLVHKTNPFAGQSLIQLVVMHHKKWDAEDIRFSVERHHRILKDRWLAGLSDLRDLEYLCQWNHSEDQLCRRDFFDRAYALAQRPLDRYFILKELGKDAARNGFWMDAEEHWEGAYRSLPELPDVPFAAGDCYAQDEMWEQAAKWYLAGIQTKWAAGATRTNPRSCAIEYPSRAAVALMHIGDRHFIDFGVDSAEGIYQKADDLLDAVRKHTAIGVDLFEANTTWAAAHNKLTLCRQVRSIVSLWNFLLANDESEKAVMLLDALPANSANAKDLVALEPKRIELQEHLTDTSKYVAFYDGEQRIEATTEEQVKAGIELRIQFAVAEIQRTGAKTVLEIGPFDGNVTVPILERCPGIITYVCVEPDDRAIDLLRGNVKDPRVTIVKGFADPGTGEMKLASSIERAVGPFDVVIAYEVIEHVQDPAGFVEGISAYLSEDGHLLISTPLGPYDRGTFWDTHPRDPRGHVRAMTVRDLHEAVGAAGLRVDSLAPRSEAYGSSQFGSFSEEKRQATPISFVALCPHWGWNASKLRLQGMGASEECLAYLAEGLAPERKTDVYTRLPTNFEPLSETILGNSWWPLEEQRFIDPKATLVISRTPSHGAQFPRNKRKILWLQDVEYPDLTKETAELYEKIVCVSDWHKSVTIDYSGIAEEKIAVIPNFLLRSEFPLKDRPARNPHGFIYASSPDRGLIPLLRMWRYIKDELPEAELNIFYGWRGIRRMVQLAQGPWVTRNFEMRTAYNELIQQDGVHDHGMVPQAVLAQAMMRSSVHAAPWTFQETDGNTFRKMMAGGVVNVCPPLAGIAESAKDPETLFVEPAEQEQFIAAVFEAVKVPESRRLAMAMRTVVSGCLEARLPAWRAVLGD